MRLSDFEALSFDCYGTLIDWESGLAEALEPLARKSGRTTEALIDAFGPIEHAVEEEFPQLCYSELLAKVHERLSASLGIAPDPEAARAFGASVGDWPAFPDSAEALRYLKRHFKLIILSNVDRASFARSNDRLGVSAAQPQTYEERAEVARRCGKLLDLGFPMLVDTIDDAVGARYSGMPGRFYLIDKAGKIAFKNARGPFGFKPAELEHALILLLQEEGTPTSPKANNTTAQTQGGQPSPPAERSNP